MSDDSRLITVNGQLFNGPITDSGLITDGVEFEITDVTGMGEPEAVFTSEQNVAADGAWATTGYRAPRALGLKGVLRAPNALRVEYAFDIFRRLISLAEFPVTFHYVTGDRTVWCRRDGALDADSRELPNEISWSCVLKCLDPAIYAGDGYGSQDIHLSTGLPQSTGGITYPRTYPIVYTGSGSTGDVTAVLGAGGYVTFRVWGPVTDPQILVEDWTTKQSRLAWLGIIPSDVFLEVDPQKRQALLQGQSSRVPYIRQWPKLGPGPNTFRFRAAAYDVGQLDITISPIL